MATSDTRDIIYNVVSVPHSGTRFTIRLLEQLELNPKREHCNPRSFGLDITLQIPENMKIVVPRRDPGRTYQSRRQRRGNYEQQPHFIPDHDQPLENLLAGIARKERLLREHSEQCILLPIDQPLPDGYWEEFADFLEIPRERLELEGFQEYVEKWAKVGAFEYFMPLAEIPPEIEAVRQRWGYSGELNER